MADDGHNLGGIIWVGFTIISIVCLLYLMIWSINTGSIAGAIVGMAFGFELSAKNTELQLPKRLEKWKWKRDKFTNETNTRSAADQAPDRS